MLMTNPSSWLDAFEFCSNSSANGKLIGIDFDGLSEVVRYWLSDYLIDTPIWIGGFAPALMNSTLPFTRASLMTTSWFWKNRDNSYVTDEKIMKPQWASDQPANGTGACVASYRDSWVASSCKNEYKFVCEYSCSFNIKVNKNAATVESGYTENARCEWFIEVKEGIVLLQFENFLLDFTESCTKDYLLIKETKNSTTVLGKFCGKLHQVPKYVRSPSNKMYVHFVTGRPISTSVIGFKATVRSSAGSIVKQQTGQGVVTSPNFPLNYLDSSTNIWQLRVSGGSIILKFTDFSLQPGKDGNCTSDGLIVREMGAEMKVLGTFCGSDLPNDIISKTGGFTLQMYTDSSISSSGFRALFWRVGDPCTEIITAKAGFITSPGYPLQIKPGTNCTWYIDVLEGVAKFSIAFSDYSCFANALEAFDGYSSDPVKLLSTESCGTQLPVVKASSRYLTITFRADPAFETRTKGFKITFTSSTECSFKLAKSSGFITSPDYPLSYDPYSNCSWNIDVVTGTVLFQVNALDLEPSLNCKKERVEVYDGNSTNALLITTFCSTKTPFIVNSTSRYIFIRFVSGDGITRSGFSANFWSSEYPCPHYNLDEFKSNILNWNNTCYGLSMPQYNSQDGTSFCEVRGMDPVRIETSEEMQAITSWIAQIPNVPSSHVWTGGYRRRANSTVWFWSQRDGDRLMQGGSSSPLWHPGFPSSLLNAAFINGALEDTNSFSTYPVICEMPAFKQVDKMIIPSKICSAPAKIFSGTYAPIKKEYDTGSTIKYSCNYGFVMNGDDTLRCLEGYWFNEAPYCISITKPLLENCSPLPKIPHLSYIPHRLAYGNSSTITFNCENGYKMVGASDLRCINGQWIDAVPECIGDSADYTKPVKDLSKGEPMTATDNDSKVSAGQHTVTYAVTLTIIALLLAVIIAGVVFFAKRNINPIRLLIQKR